MNIEELRDYCLSLKGVEEKMPFDDKTLVFTVKNKMFCLTDIETYEFVNLKCDPETAIELREKYSEVTPGFHMNKKHWNSVLLLYENKKSSEISLGALLCVCIGILSKKTGCFTKN